VKVPRLLYQLGLKKKTQVPVRLPDALPYPAQVRRRTFHEERVGKRVLDLGVGIGHLAAGLEKMGGSVVCLEGRPENLEAMRSRYLQIEGHVADVENEPLSRFGHFDGVFSYGLFYHLENPLHAIRKLESVCGELLRLESMVCDHDRPVVLVEDESSDVNQALAGLGSRPSPHYVVLALNRAGFAYVYAPAQPPAHADFRFEWRNGLDCVRDGHPLRCVFVASRGELRNPNLVPLLVE